MTEPRKRKMILALLAGGGVGLATCGQTAIAAHPQHRPKGAGPIVFTRPKYRGPRATPAQSKHVLACLKQRGLSKQSVGAPALWVANDNTGAFVYVQLYASNKTAAAAAHQLRHLETGVATRFVVKQAITPYTGSPVPRVVGCLHGHMVSKRPVKQKPIGF